MGTPTEVYVNWKQPPRGWELLVATEEYIEDMGDGFLVGVTPTYLIIEGQDRGNNYRIKIPIKNVADAITRTSQLAS